MGKRVVLLVGMLLGMLASGVQAESIDLDGHLFVEARLGYQTYLKTAQKDWHYDDGTLLGFRLTLPIAERVKICISEAAIVTNQDEGYASGLQMGVVGQRVEISAQATAPNDFIGFGLKYHFYSWFVGDDQTYGPAYMINTHHTVHQLFLNAEMKIF